MIVGDQPFLPGNWNQPPLHKKNPVNLYMAGTGTLANREEVMYVFPNTNSRTSRYHHCLHSSMKNGSFTELWYTGGFPAVIMAENANLQRGVVMSREYPQTRSAMMHSMEKNTDCTNRQVISGEQRGIETGKDFCKGLKYENHAEPGKDAAGN